MTQKRALYIILLILALGLAFLLLFTDVALAMNPAENLDDPNFSFDLNAITDQGITGTIKQRWIRGGVNYFFGRVIGFMAGVIGGVAVLIMVYGGFLILSSAGSEDLYQKGVDYIKYSALGLAAVLSAYILVNAVQLLINSIYG